MQPSSSSTSSSSSYKTAVDRDGNLYVSPTPRVVQNIQSSRFGSVDPSVLGSLPSLRQQAVNSTTASRNLSDDMKMSDPSPMSEEPPPPKTPDELMNYPENGALSLVEEETPLELATDVFNAWMMNPEQPGSDISPSRASGYAAPENSTATFFDEETNAAAFRAAQFHLDHLHDNESDDGALQVTSDTPPFNEPKDHSPTSPDEFKKHG